MTLGVLLALTPSLRAQLVPLLPPPDDAASEEATPQQSKAERMLINDLENDRFAALDEIAERFRSSKARARGGGWRLRTFYAQLDPKQPSDEAMEQHIAKLDEWMKARPQSITPRVAMAQALIRWAWMARGNAVAIKVADSAWPLFEGRIKRAREVLEGGAKLQPMCPAWYSAMMVVARAEGWEKPKMQALFEQAVQFEPDYTHFYIEYAEYLLPKWEGERGELTSAATLWADRVGGDEGDFIYFEVATVVIHRGNGGIPKNEMDWARMQRGAKVLAARYGLSRGNRNQLAFMAWEYRDREVGKPLFEAIGDHFAPAVWKDREHYDAARSWATRTNGLTPREPPAATDE
jgi:hypothetical protein